jgi:hypothetical protein
MTAPPCTISCVAARLTSYFSLVHPGLTSSHGHLVRSVFSPRPTTSPILLQRLSNSSSASLPSRSPTDRRVSSTHIHLLILLVVSRTSCPPTQNCSAPLAPEIPPRNGYYLTGLVGHCTGCVEQHPKHLTTEDPVCVIRIRKYTRCLRGKNQLRKEKVGVVRLVNRRAPDQDIKDPSTLFVSQLSLLVSQPTTPITICFPLYSRPATSKHLSTHTKPKHQPHPSRCPASRPFALPRPNHDPSSRAQTNRPLPPTRRIVDGRGHRPAAALPGRLLERK